jgi:1,4-dihydroxy-2-naphthoate octaprenyltransferase
MSSIPPPPLPGPTVNHPRAIGSLVCGVVGIAILPLIFGIIAIILGYQSRKDIGRFPEKYKGDGLAMSGLVLGVLDVAGSLLLLAGMI